MTEKSFEILSAIMDGETEPDQSTLEKIAQDERLRKGWTRYHLIRSVIQDRQATAIRSDFQSRIRMALEDEPTVLAPKRKNFNIAGFAKQATGMAIAATIATVAVITVQNSSIESQTENDIVASTVANEKQELQTVSTQDNSRLSNNLEARLSGYLVNHNEFSGRTSVRIIPAYSRIVSITPGERVINE